MATWILVFSLITGQIIKIPGGTGGGLTVLDITIIFLNIVALFSLKFKLKKPPLWLFSAFIFLFFASLSLLFTPLNLTITQYLTSFTYTLRIANFFLFGWVILSGSFPKILENAGKILIFSGIGMAFSGLFQLIFLPDLSFLAREGWDPHFFRTASTLLDPNFTGGYLALTLILLATSLGKLLPQKLLISFFVVVYIAFVTTFSRSAALFFIISFSTLSYLKKSLKLFILGFILFTGFFFIFNTYQKTIAAPRNIDRESSAQARIDTWQQGIEIFKRSPILGVGFNSYRFALEQYELTPSEFLQSRGSSTNDSSLLYILATTGILGFLSYIVFLTLAAKQAVKSKSTWGLMFVAGLSGLIFNSFFVNSLFYPWFLFWLILTAVKTETDKD